MAGFKHGPMKVFVDNKSAIHMASNPVHPDRNLHIHARYFYIRDLVEGKHYVILHAPSYDMIADLLCTFKSNDTFARLYMLVMNNATYEYSDEQHAYAWNLNTVSWRGIVSKGGDGIVDCRDTRTT